MGIIVRRLGDLLGQHRGVGVDEVFHICPAQGQHHLCLPEGKVVLRKLLGDMIPDGDQGTRSGRSHELDRGGT